jgi:hypothetical protein
MNNKLILSAAAGALALAASASAADAATYSVAGDYGASVFDYGRGVGGTSFVSYIRQGANCGSQLFCSDDGAGSLPQVVKNSGASDFASGTVVIKAGELNFHPGAGGPGTDSIVRFLAPTAGTYTISGSFSRRDVTSSGDGSLASIFSNIGGVSTSLFSMTIANTSYGSSTTFGGLVVNLGAGDSIDFALNNAGDFTFDSVALGATISNNISAVPEPATWAMMISGFGMAGAALRRRVRTSITYA